jgi:hypothetical protein
MDTSQFNLYWEERIGEVQCPLPSTRTPHPYLHIHHATPPSQTDLCHASQSIRLLPPPSQRPIQSLAFAFLFACRWPGAAEFSLRSLSCSTKSFKIVSRPSFRRVSNITSSILMVRRPACVAKDSRSCAAVPAKALMRQLRRDEDCHASTFAHRNGSDATEGKQRPHTGLILSAICDQPKKERG